jgi:hypothetical protein
MFGHAATELTHRAERAPQVEVDDPGEGVVVDLQQRPADVDARRRHQHVWGGHPAYGAGHARGGEDVQLERLARASHGRDRIGGPARARRVQVGADGAGAEGGQGVGAGLADAAGRADDKRRAARKVEEVAVLHGMPVTQCGSRGSTVLIALKVAVGVAACLACSAAPWATPRVRGRALMVVLGAFAATALIGAIIGLPLYPYTNAVVLGVATSGGVLLGRALPTRFRPVLIVLLALSVLDLAQVVVFNGPPNTAPSTQSAVPDPHLIWLNFRVSLPSGHFNIGFADLLLVTALAENFRRTRTSWPVAALPGASALVMGTLVASAPVTVHFAAGAFSEALVPYLTAGWLLAIAVAGIARRDPLWPARTSR